MLYSPSLTCSLALFPPFPLPPFFLHSLFLPSLYPFSPFSLPSLFSPSLSHPSIPSLSPLCPSHQLRVYSWRTVRQELEEAKDCFLEMAVSVTKEHKIVLPKILDW